MPPGGDSQARQQRLAAKLRENLRRRKKQAEARKPKSDTEKTDRQDAGNKD